MTMAKRTRRNFRQTPQENRLILAGSLAGELRRSTIAEATSTPLLSFTAHEMQGQRVVLMGSSTSGADADGGEHGTNTNNASPSSERSEVQQLGSTDSSDGHLRSSSDFDAANAAAAAAAATATAAAAGGLGDTDDPNSYHSLPSPEAAAADNALMRSMEVASGDDDDNTNETPTRQEALHINHRHHHDQRIPMAPPRLLTVVPPASSSVVDLETGTAAITTPDTTPHLNKQFIMELIAWYRNRSWQKKLITTAFFVVACVVYADLFGLFWEDSKIHAGLELFLEWMDQNSIAASFAFIGMFILTTLIFIPPFLMTFGAGFVFVDVYGFAYGMALAMITCFLGSCIGGIIAFARARYMTRELVKLFAKRYPIIDAVDKALKRSGFKVMLLLRLCSIIPFSALNYIGGVTGVRLSCFVNSMIGIIPSQLLTVLFGATAGSLKNSDIAENWTMSNIVWLSVTGACGLLAIIVTIYFARKEIKKEISREDTESLNPDSVRRSSTGMASQAGDEIEMNGTAASRERKSEEWWWVWA